MNTTVLFVELLIIGMEVVIWIGLLLLDLFGLSFVAIARTLFVNGLELLTTILLLSLSYVLGIIFDRFAHKVFSSWNDRLKVMVIPNPPKAISAMRFELGKENEYLNHQLEYTRARIRLVRASSLNFVIITLLSIIFVITRLNTVENSFLYVALIFISGLMITISSLYSWRSLVLVYLKLIKTNYNFKNKPRSLGGRSKQLRSLN